jgi:hypothetical protein
MTINEFVNSLQEKEIPKSIQTLPNSDLLTALWHEANGNWEYAHDLAQEKETPLYCLVHAYLHRKEGDQWNAGYWYRRAGRTMTTTSLSEEWRKIAEELLG